MNKEEIKQEPNDGLIARILGGTPTNFTEGVLYTYGIFADIMALGMLCFYILL